MSIRVVSHFHQLFSLLYHLLVNSVFFVLIYGQLTVFQVSDF